MASSTATLPDFAQEFAFLAASRRTGSQSRNLAHGERHERATAPLVTLSALQAAGQDVFPQRSLLGVTAEDEPVYFNTNTPCSGVVCGVQGSGKSHTVSCLLENTLIVDGRIGNLPKPLAGLVFHFDAEEGHRPCEAAYLGTPSPEFSGRSSISRITVLASAHNIENRRRTYASLANADVQPLFLAETDITAMRLLSLMGWQADSDKLPLYLHTVMHIVRSMGADGFSYTAFKQLISQEKFDTKQKMMLHHRLRLLDDFLKPEARAISSYFATGELVLVDLTDPYLDGVMASTLFNIMLSSFTAWECSSGKIVVLDEAHKYLDAQDSSSLTESIATIIRQHRHFSTRVIIATQEPTVVPATILDLSSFIICHRFSSPAWCSHLSRHVSSDDKGWFDTVMRLPTGDAVVFAPTAVTSDQVVPLGRDSMRVSVRSRLTCDGGASVMAVSTTHDVRQSPPPTDFRSTTPKVMGSLVQGSTAVSLSRLEPPASQAVTRTPSPLVMSAYDVEPFSPNVATPPLPAFAAPISSPPPHTDLESAAAHSPVVQSPRPVFEAAIVLPESPPAISPPRPAFEIPVITVPYVLPSIPRGVNSAGMGLSKGQRKARNKRIKERFQDLIDVLLAERDAGNHSPTWSHIAQSLQHLSGGKGWFKQYMDDAKAEGIVTLGNRRSPGRETVSLCDAFC